MSATKKGIGWVGWLLIATGLACAAIIGTCSYCVNKAEQKAAERRASKAAARKRAVDIARKNIEAKRAYDALPAKVHFDGAKAGLDSVFAHMDSFEKAGWGPEHCAYFLTNATDQLAGAISIMQEDADLVREHKLWSRNTKRTIEKRTRKCVRSALKGGSKHRKTSCVDLIDRALLNAKIDARVRSRGRYNEVAYIDHVFCSRVWIREYRDALDPLLKSCRFAKVQCGNSLTTTWFDLGYLRAPYGEAARFLPKNLQKKRD